MSHISRVLRVVPLIAGAAALLAAGSLQARVTKITIDSKTALFNGRTFGNVGAYEQIKGTVRGEIDPADRRNAVITDIQFAPRNANGRVEYTSSFTISKPIGLLLLAVNRPVKPLKLTCISKIWNVPALPSVHA